MEKGVETQSKEKSRKMTIEDYLDFIDDKRSPDLTARNLIQIIRIHAFKSLGRSPEKNLLIDIVGTMELMDLSRSTVKNDGVSPSAHLTLKEVIGDLKDINWPECHVTSLLGLNAAGSHVLSIPVTSDKKRKPKKMRKIGLDCDGDVVNSSATSAAATTIAAVSACAPEGSTTAGT